MHELPRLRLALGLGDQEREQRLRPTLDADDELVVVAQCLAADQLLSAVEAHRADAAVVAWGLHRLTDAAVAQLERSGLPLVLLVPDTDDPRWRQLRSVVVPLDADSVTVRQAIQAAVRGERFTPTRRRPTLDAAPTADLPPEPATLSIITVTGGSGSPGRTTVAINLAAALGTVAPTVLVDADLTAPSVAAYLDCDPSRNLCTLAHAMRERPHAWGQVLSDELQPLSPCSPAGLVLCGPPEREMRTSVSAELIERLVRELARRYRFVVLDTGAELLGTSPAASVHRVAISSAHQVLVVAASDLVGVWHARTVLQQLQGALDVDPRRTSLVINRHDPRHHHSPAEIAWHLGSAAAAVIPYDYRPVQRASSQQQPLVSEPSSRAARALIGLAERLQRSQALNAPVDHARAARTDWLRRVFGRRRVSRSNPPSAPAAARGLLSGRARSRV